MWGLDRGTRSLRSGAWRRGNGATAISLALTPSITSASGGRSLRFDGQMRITIPQLLPIKTGCHCWQRATSLSACSRISLCSRCAWRSRSDGIDRQLWGPCALRCNQRHSARSRASLQELHRSGEGERHVASFRWNFSFTPSTTVTGKDKALDALLVDYCRRSLNSPLRNELIISFQPLKLHPESDEPSVRRRAAGRATSVVALLPMDE